MPIGRSSPVEVLAAVRGASGDGVVGLRFSGDELAPWAGITPEQAPPIAAALAEWIDYIVVVRGAIFSVEKTRPDFHEPTNFNVELCRAVRSAVPAAGGRRVAGIGRRRGRGSRFVADGVADAVEMTRAQIADPDLVRKTAAGDADAAVHPLQPDVPGARRPQPHRDVRGRADERTGDGRSRLVRTGETACRHGGGRRPGRTRVRVALLRGHQVSIVEQK